MKKTTLILALAILPAFMQSLHAQIIRTIAGTGATTSSGDGGPATAAGLANPRGVYYTTGGIYVTEYSGHRIRKIDPMGTISLFAGNGVAGYGGDGGPATAGSMKYPIDIIEDASGNVYFIDNNNHRVRKINTAGIISTFAGNGIAAYSGDGGPATAASLRDPGRITIGPGGNIYISDGNNNVIRKIDASGIITTVAGTGVAGFSGDGGPATAAKLSLPHGVAFDVNGNMYIADAANRRIRKVTPSGIISTLSGTGVNATTGDGGPATAASMQYPNGVAVDLSCNVYFSDWAGQRIRRITTSGYISTVVGTGAASFSGDGGPASLATINGPNNLSFDLAMNLYIPEYYNNRIRKVENLGETSMCAPISPHASFSSSSLTVCQDSCVTVTNTTVGIIDSVRWIVTPSATVASPTLSSTSICFPSTGLVAVKLRVYNGAGYDSSVITISVSPAPHPVITQAGATLSVPAVYSAYQWFLGSSAISGAVTSSYNVSTPGTYSVQVDSAGCRGASAAFTPTVGTGLYGVGEDAVRIGRATNGEPIIYKYGYDELDIALLDMTGRTLFTHHLAAGTGSYTPSHMAALAPGIYIIRIMGNNTSMALRWVR